MGVADLITIGSVDFAVGLFGAFDEAAVGDKILDRGEAVDRFDLVEDDQGQDFAYPGNGLKQGIGPQIVLFGRSDDLMFELGQETIVGFDHQQVGADALLDGGVIKAFNDAFAILGFGNTAQGIGQVILVSGILDMGKELSPFSHEVISSSEEISRCSHPDGIDIRLRDHPSSKQGSDLMGVDLVVFGFSSVNRFHIEGMA